MANRYTPNPAFTAQLEASPFVQRVLRSKAEEAGMATRAEAETFRNTGSYVESIEVDGTRVLTTDPAGHLIEFGSAKNPPYAPLRRGAEAIGATVVDEGSDA